MASFCLLAEAAAAIGEPALALAALDAIAPDHQGAFFAPEIQRVRGEVLRRRDGAAAAEPCFRRAIELARARSERALELRAATSLARLLATLGRRAEARGALGEVYEWFSEGFETTDLRAARATLDELDAGVPAPPVAS